MPTTSPYLLPYPAASDPADVPTDMGELANAVDDVLVTLDGRIDALEAVGGITHFCQLTRTTNLTVPDGASTWTAIPWDNEEQDPFTMHAPGATAILLATTGIWLFNVTADFNIPAAAGRLGVRFGFAGGGFGAIKVSTQGSGGGSMPLATSWVNYLGGGGSVTAEVNQSGMGGAYVVLGGSMRLTATRLG